MDVQLLSEYLEYLEIEKGLSSNTIDAYRRDLTNFLDFCTSKGLNNFSKIEKNQMNSYIMQLHDKNFNPRSVVLFRSEVLSEKLLLCEGFSNGFVQMNTLNKIPHK